jgi:hypothetical protein
VRKEGGGKNQYFYLNPKGYKGQASATMPIASPEEIIAFFGKYSILGRQKTKIIDPRNPLIFHAIDMPGNSKRALKKANARA